MISACIELLIQNIVGTPKGTQRFLMELSTCLLLCLLANSWLHRWQCLVARLWERKHSLTYQRKSSISEGSNTWMSAHSASLPRMNWKEEVGHLKERRWCWERMRTEEGSNRGGDGWMASPTPWTWVWANSGKMGKPSVLQFMGSLSDQTTTSLIDMVNEFFLVRNAFFRLVLFLWSAIRAPWLVS